MNRIFASCLLIFASCFANAKNPIISNMGVNDPHIRIIDGKAYLSASHDKSIDNKQFIMENWQLWSSDNLVDWKLESTLQPEQTYIGKPFTGCWATDIAKRDGKYYWYFSEKNEQSGVVVADSPAGPWKDPLGKPLLSAEMTPTHEYDMGIIQDDKGEYYIVFGVWDYYIARLNKDMISLAEEPKLINIKNPLGPYNLDGKNTKMPTDDKPFIHTHNGKCYLSWGCFYAMADNVYGPYDYKGTIVEKESFAPGYDSPTWPTGFKQGRHGSFFEWHNQSYFAYCDISQTGNRYFRDTFISYLHYKDNGEMALIRIDGIGVGEYDTNKKIEAEEYFETTRMLKAQNAGGGFSVSGLKNGDYLTYNQLKNLGGKTNIQLNVTVLNTTKIELRRNSPKGKLIKKFTLKKGASNPIIEIGTLDKTENLVFLFNGKKGSLIDFDYFQFM